MISGDLTGILSLKSLYNGCSQEGKRVQVRKPMGTLVTWQAAKEGTSCRELILHTPSQQRMEVVLALSRREGQSFA